MKNSGIYDSNGVEIRDGDIIYIELPFYHEDSAGIGSFPSRRIEKKILNGKVTYSADKGGFIFQGFSPDEKVKRRFTAKLAKKGKACILPF